MVAALANFPKRIISRVGWAGVVVGAGCTKTAQASLHLIAIRELHDKDSVKVHGLGELNDDSIRSQSGTFSGDSVGGGIVGITLSA